MNAHTDRHLPSTAIRLFLALAVFTLASVFAASTQANSIRGSQSSGALGNAAVAYRIYDDLHTQDGLAVADELISANAITHTPEGEFAGATGYREFATSLQSAFPNATFAIDVVTTKGDIVSLHWTMIAVQQGTYHGMPTSCGAVNIDGITMFRIDQGLIAESWVAYDRLAVMDQIAAFSEVDASLLPSHQTCAIEVVAPSEMPGQHPR